MRIASTYTYESSIHMLQRRQQSLSSAQEQLTSGKRVLKASDDPADAARAERALAAMSRNEAQQRALDASRNAMELGESALGEAGELMQQARELVISAGNSSYTDAERRTIADSLRGLRNDLFAIANRDDGAGRYLFGGQGSDRAPFADAAGGVTFDGMAGQLGAVNEGTALSIDGRVAWMQGADPDNPGATISVFDALDRTIGAMLDTGTGSAEVAQTVSAGLARIDATTGNLAAARSRAGEALNRSDRIENRLAQGKLDAKRELSSAQDLDMLDAISEFQNQQTGYSAALQTYSMVQKMSLFDYLR
jgi:flagellar hook-associated protein 3 FlgL